MVLIIWLVAGILVGLVGRALTRADRHKIPVWLALLCGIGGIFVGQFGYHAVIGSGGGVQWVVALVVGGLFVAIASALANRGRSRAVVAGRPHIFLSYRQEHSYALAGRIADHLKQHFPRAIVFMDIESIALSENFRLKISQALHQSQVLLAVVDPDWTGGTSGRRRLDEPGDFVAFELRTAAQLRIPIIPIIAPFASIPSANALPTDLAWLADRQSLQLHHAIGFDLQMAQLDEQLVSLLGRSRG